MENKIKKNEFNQDHLDEYAYKLLWVGRSQRKVSDELFSLRLHVGPETRPGRGESLVYVKEQRMLFCCFLVNMS